MSREEFREMIDDMDAQIKTGHYEKAEEIRLQVFKEFAKLKAENAELERKLFRANRPELADSIDLSELFHKKRHL